MRDRNPRLRISRAQSHHSLKLLLLIESFKVELWLVIQNYIYFRGISTCLFHCPRQKSKCLLCDLGGISIKMHLRLAHAQIHTLLAMDFLAPSLANVADYE